MIIKRIFILATALMQISAAQPREIVVREQTSDQYISYECHPFRYDTIQSVIIPFRIRFDFFVFTKPTENAAAKFTANGEVSIEILDSTETSIARKILPITLSTNDNAPAKLKLNYHQELFTFQIPPGRYSTVVKVEDRESKRQFVENRKPIPERHSRTFITGLIPFQQHRQDHYVLFNLGGDVLFSQNYGFLFLAKKVYSKATYSIDRLLPDDEKESLVVDSTISLNINEHTSLIAGMNNESVILSSSESKHEHLYSITFDGQRLRQGRYEFTVTFEDSTTIRTRFGARWLEMPLSLTDLDIATEPLQFIMTKDDYYEMRRGGRESRIEKFDNYWKKKDPTPNTAYNEVMHEFYRRVDFAIAAFRTMREMNGAITDRGKIYLLYGKPTTTERLLSPEGAPREIWKYHSLNKTFVFEDPSKQGNYKLAENK